MKQWVIALVRGAGDEQDAAEPETDFIVQPTREEALAEYAQRTWGSSTAIDAGEEYLVTEVGQPTKRLRIQSAKYTVRAKEVE